MKINNLKLKAITFLISFFLSLCVINPKAIFAEENPDINSSFTTGYMYYFDMKSDVPNGIQVQYSTNLDYLLSLDNSQYNKNLAITAEVLASDVYHNVKVGNSNASYSADECLDETSIYINQLNMDDAQLYELKKEDYVNDSNDVTRFVISHKYIADDNKEIIVVAIEGTNSTLEQWKSNFDVGASDGSYLGQHDEWLDHDNHKGFDVTYRRMLNKVNEYISSNINSSAEKQILITGHSRGGALANLLGKYFEDNSDYKSFTYTFAAPGVTTKADTSANTIFNIINEDDVIPYYPLSSWGFHRYGTDIKVNLTNLTSTWKDLTGIDYKTCNGSNIVDLALAVADSREGLYVFNETPVYSSSSLKAESETKISDLKAQLSNDGFSNNYYRYDKIDSSTTRDSIKCYISPAFLMESLAGLVTTNDYVNYLGDLYGTPVNISKIKTYKVLVEFMAEKYTNNSMVHAHCTYAYYVAATSAKADYDGNKTVSIDVSTRLTLNGEVDLPSLPNGMSYGIPECEDNDVGDLSICDDKLLYTGQISENTDKSYTISIPVIGDDEASYNDYEITIIFKEKTINYPTYNNDNNNENITTTTTKVTTNTNKNKKQIISATETVINSADGTSTRQVTSSDNSEFMINADSKLIPTGTVFNQTLINENDSAYQTIENIINADDKNNLKAASNLFAYDLNLKESDGTAIHQLDGYVEVSLPLPKDIVINPNEHLNVYRINDDNTLTKCESEVKDGVITFKTDHFSLYIFAIEENEVEDTVQINEISEETVVNEQSTIPFNVKLPIIVICVIALIGIVIGIIKVKKN